jgi:hypothetical protein
VDPQEAEWARLREMETFDPAPYRESWDSLRSGAREHDIPRELRDLRARSVRRPGTSGRSASSSRTSVARPTYRDGYRIQIFSTPNRQEAEQKRIEALQQLAYPVYVVFQSPYYRVHVGDFLTRAQAQRALSEVRLRYPSAWVVPDRVRVPD